MRIDSLLLSNPNNDNAVPVDFTNSLKSSIDGVMSTFPTIDYRLIGDSVFGPVGWFTQLKLNRSYECLIIEVTRLFQIVSTTP